MQSATASGVRSSARSRRAVSWEHRRDARRAGLRATLEQTTYKLRARRRTRRPRPGWATLGSGATRAEGRSGGEDAGRSQSSGWRVRHRAAISIAFAHEGARVAVLDLRAEAATAVAGEAGEEAGGYGCDVGRRLYATASRGGSGSVGSVVLPSLVRQAWSTSIARPLMNGAMPPLRPRTPAQGPSTRRRAPSKAWRRQALPQSVRSGGAHFAAPRSS